MEDLIKRDAAYGPSGDIVAREIEGEVVIVPLASGVGDMEGELYTLNETGRAIWRKLDGTKKVREIAAELSEEFEAPPEVLEADVAGLLAELLKRKMVAEKE
ncbi:MAG: PqqD family protein [Candidatus Aminicenantes bacterium]|nr:PqqD family protein [Candidatus Aminicenantes bacterium]